MIATGDDFRRVKIFKYPCPKEKSKYKEYKGHSEFVVNVKFSKDGKWLYTVGGLDKAVFQFEVKTGNSTTSSTTSFTSAAIASATAAAVVASKSNTTPSANPRGKKSRIS